MELDGGGFGMNSTLEQEGWVKLSEGDRVYARREWFASPLTSRGRIARAALPSATWRAGLAAARFAAVCDHVAATGRCGRGSRSSTGRRRVYAGCGVWPARPRLVRRARGVQSLVALGFRRVLALIFGVSMAVTAWGIVMPRMGAPRSVFAAPLLHRARNSPSPQTGCGVRRVRPRRTRAERATRMHCQLNIERAILRAISVGVKRCIRFA
jgi:hypothetical protein